MLELAIFDLDNTLLGGDSDYLWGQYLVSRGHVDGEEYEQANQRFYDDYKAGTLDIHEFQRFSQRPLTQHNRDTLNQWHQEFMEEFIRPIVLPKAADLLEEHRQAGRKLMIITATNRFVTGPIAEALGVDTLLATETGQDEAGNFTGELVGVPCFQEGKVTRLDMWLKESGYSLRGSWFYSDSHNDLPLLEMVDNAVAVDPDETLRQTALSRGWPVISLRD